jgi:LPS sulfotransferase NodH
MQKSLIICATPRSGSYLLSDLLHQSGLPFAEEWLTPFHQSSRKKAYAEKESLGFVDYLKCLSRRERINGIFTMKIMYPQFYSLMQTLQETDTLPGNDWFERFQYVFPNPHFVHITRLNKLAQAISHSKARQTGQWVKRKDKTDKAVIEPVYSFLGICRALEDRATSEKLWNDFFRDKGLYVTQVTYEELVENGQSTLQDLVSRLGLPVNPTQKIESTRTFLQMASGVNREWEDRYDMDQQASVSDTSLEREMDLEKLTICHVGLRDRFEVGGRYHLDVNVHASSPVNIEGRPDGEGWLRVTGMMEGPGENEPDPFEQELRKDGSGGYSARCFLPVAYHDGAYCLKLVLSARALTLQEVREIPGRECELVFKHPPPRDQSRELLPSTVDLRNGWQYLDWFGYFLDDKFPWVYTADHEWLYFKPEFRPEQGYHILDANLGWLEVQPEKYPEVYSLDREEKWKFLRRQGNKRWFRVISSGREFCTETNRPEHLRQLNMS